ncbi:MAG: hypothetical protein HY064_00540 [Bacteroidetes bacterium]|nr:hypothetical protein [Bacteroidota bacterium]
MKTDHEKEARMTMESLENIFPAEVPLHLEKKFLEKLELEKRSSGRAMKFFWAAAVILFAVNAFAAFNYLDSPGEVPKSNTSNSSTDKTMNAKLLGKYYFDNTSSWYQ